MTSVRSGANQQRHSTLPFGMFLVWLVWVPLPLGSNRPIWLSVSMAWLCLIWVVVLVKWVRRRFHMPRAFRQARIAWSVLLIFLAWQVLQLFAPVFLVPEYLKLAYEQAGATSPGITLDAHAGYGSLLLTVQVLGAFMCSLMLVDSMYRVHLLLWTIVWVGVVLSIVTGITVMDASDWEFFGIKFSSNGLASGSFVNRNHFANYLIMSLAAGIGLLISMQDRRHGLSWRQRVQAWAETLLGPKARLRIFLALMVITLVLTRSRMGNTAFFASLLVVGVLTLVLIRGRGRHRSLFILISSLVIIDVFIVGAWFGVEQVMDRIQQTVVVDDDAIVINAQDRIDASRETWGMVQELPLSGSGGGGYFARYPAYRTLGLGYFDHAHNDYLEFTANYGVPAMLLWLAFLLFTIHKAIKQLRLRNHPLALGACFTSMMAFTAMAIHATVDFSLQIPANGILFMVLLSLPWVVSGVRRDQQ